MTRNSKFVARGPDVVTEELAKVLSKDGSWEFLSLFDLVHANLRSRNQARDQEMMRLRAHEKLQNFVRGGLATKNGKEYKGVPEALANFFKTTAELKAKLEQFKRSRVAPKSEVSDNGAEAANVKLPKQKAKAGVVG